MARPEVTGRKNETGKKTALTEVAVAERDAYSIEAFCRRHSISIAQYYKMRQRRLTPLELRVGTRVLISKESAAEWRHQREADSTA
jgi:hypothetical protein